VVKKKHIIIPVIGFIIGYLVLYYSPFYISYIVGTSMNPQIQNYDIMVMEEGAEVEVGDVARVQIEERTHAYSIVHEVVEANETHVITKGVNTSSRDRPTPRENVQAKVLYSFTPPEPIKNAYGVFLPDGYNELDTAVREGSILCVLESPTNGEHLGDNVLSPIC
jgi:signal peptidase I